MMRLCSLSLQKCNIRVSIMDQESKHETKHTFALSPIPGAALFFFSSDPIIPPIGPPIPGTCPDFFFCSAPDPDPKTVFTNPC